MECSLNAVILKATGVGPAEAAAARLDKACVFGCKELRDLKAARAGNKAQAGKGE